MQTRRIAGIIFGGFVIIAMADSDNDASLLTVTPFDSSTSSPSFGSSGLQTERFLMTFSDIRVHFQVVKLQRSCFIWIGDDHKLLDNLTVALPNPFSLAPLLTQIMDRRGADTISLRDEGQRIASKLSKKLNAQVFVSFSVDYPPEFDMVGNIEAFLFGLLRTGEKLVLWCWLVDLFSNVVCISELKVVRWLL